jgi:parallel beta-helix repeat protein
MRLGPASSGRATDSSSRPPAVAGVALVLAAVVALLLWPPNAGGATVACGQSITQDTRLDNDLSCPFQALSIGADNVTLDLNGHRIAGAPAIVTGREGATIENGVIEATGPVGPPGIQLDQAHGTTLRGLWVVGFRIERGPFSLGIDVNESHGVTIRGSVVYGHGAALRLLGSGDNRVLENAFVNNGSAVLLSDADRNRVVANLLQDNGLAINAGGNRNHIRANDARQNEIGIIASCGQGSVLRANRTRRNRANGIQVEACASGTLLWQNVARRNGADGIHVDAPSAVLHANRASFNGDLGIEAVPGVTDAGGNRARGNGNPAQCQNVACSV